VVAAIAIVEYANEEHFHFKVVFNSTFLDKQNCKNIV
jgi:hypothetical protein